MCNFLSIEAICSRDKQFVLGADSLKLPSQFATIYLLLNESKFDYNLSEFRECFQKMENTKMFAECVATICERSLKFPKPNEFIQFIFNSLPSRITTLPTRRQAGCATNVRIHN